MEPRSARESAGIAYFQRCPDDIMQVIRFVDCKSKPWKNGGGVTTELALSPPGATLDNFDWRLSIARIDKSGPFSRFFGIDRTLAVISGGSVALHVEGQSPVVLEPSSGYAAFPGDLYVYAEVSGAGSEDFNVMSRRGRCSHELACMELRGGTRIERRMESTFVFHAAGTRVAVDAGAAHVELQLHDGLLLEAGDDHECTLIPDRTATVFAVHFSRARF